MDRNKGEARVPHGKGDVHRTVRLDDSAFDFLDRWLDKQERLGFGPRGKHPASCTLDGGPLSPAYSDPCSSGWQFSAKRVGIGKRGHPHSMRQSGAAGLRGEGVNIGISSKQLGHSSIVTTARYLDHIAPEHVVETIRKREWNL